MISTSGPAVEMPQNLTRARQATSVLFFVNGVVIASWASRIPDVQRHLGLSDGQLGIALIGMVAGALPAMSLASRMIAVRGSRSVARFCALFLCLALPLPVLAWNALSLFAALMLLGGASGAFNVANNVQGADLEVRYRRPIMISFHALYSFGGLAGAFVGSRIAALNIGAAWHLTSIAGVLLVLGAIASPRLLSAEAAARSTRSYTLRSLTPLLRLGLIAFCTVFTEGAVADWSAVYLRRDLKAAAGTAALGYGAFALMMVVGRIIGDRVAHRWGDRLLVRGSALVATIGLGTALAAGSIGATLFGFACVGLGCACVFPTVVRASGRLSSLAPDVTIGAISTVGYLGFFVGPPLIGLVADHLTLRVALVLVVVTSAVVAGLAPADASAAAPGSAPEQPA